MKLYEINHEIADTIAKHSDPETGEITEDGIAILEELGIEKKVKYENMIKIHANISSDISAMDVELERIQNLKKSKQKRLDSLKSYMQFSMENAKSVKEELSIGTISLVKCPPRLVITDEDAVQDAFKKERTVITIDKENLKDQIQKGLKCEYAHIEQGVSLRIK